MKSFLPGAGVLLSCLLALPAAASELPKWLTDALAREAPLPAGVLATVASEDGWFQTRVPGAVRHKVVLAEGSYSVVVQVADDVTVHCEVVPDPRDLASLLAVTAEAGFQEIGQVNGEVQFRGVDTSDAGVAGPHPYLALNWIYRVQQKGEQRVGGLKQFAADLGEAAVYCTHDELGYTQTFQTVTQTLVRELRVLGKPVADPYFREVSVLSLNGQRVGVASTTLVRDEDNDTRVLTKSAILVQRAPGQLMSQDTMDLQWVRPDHTLINALYVEVSDGRVTEDMALRSEDGRWHAKGTLAGKEVAFELPGAPDTSIAQTLARRQMLAHDKPVGRSTEGRVWSSLDLTQLLPTRATVVAAAGEGAFAVREELGSVTIETVLDRKTGTMLKARLPMGPLVLDIDRVLQQGAF